MANLEPHYIYCNRIIYTNLSNSIFHKIFIKLLISNIILIDMIGSSIIYSIPLGYTIYY